MQCGFGKFHLVPTASGDFENFKPRHVWAEVNFHFRGLRLF